MKTHHQIVAESRPRCTVKVQSVTEEDKKNGVFRIWVKTIMPAQFVMLEPTNDHELLRQYEGVE